MASETELSTYSFVFVSLLVILQCCRASGGWGRAGLVSDKSCSTTGASNTAREYRSSFRSSRWPRSLANLRHCNGLVQFIETRSTKSAEQLACKLYFNNWECYFTSLNFFFSFIPQSPSLEANVTAHAKKSQTANLAKKECSITVNNLYSASGMWEWLHCNNMLQRYNNEYK